MNPPSRGAKTALRERRPRTEKVASVVAREIVREIIDRDLPPGAPLAPEADMLQNFEVSRASLREALRILETQGLITIRPGPGGGPSVAEMDSRDFGRMATLFYQVMRAKLGDVIEARLALEPVMARLAATRRDPAMNEELRESMKAHYGEMSEEEWREITDNFHGLICSMSGNPLLDILARSLKDIYTARVSGLVFPEEKHDNVRKTHEKIVKAIEKGDGATAQKLMHDHMANYAEYFSARYPGLMDELVDWG
jgi:GntR family transcriptional regulator, transcriptional repressor for pyruvate dehydrogenase complex